MLEAILKRKMNPRASMTSRESIYKGPKELLSEGPPMPGDIELYNFSLPEDCKEPVFSSSQYPKYTFTELKADPKAIMNEGVLNLLLTNCLLKTDPCNSKSSSVRESKTANQLKILKQSLNRIARYNNKRKYEERLGFVSTLTAKAEEIGITNTINFLSKAITNHIVGFKIKQ